MRKELGKIQKAEFGAGGYQEAMIGISFTLGGDGWGIGDFWGYWAMERSPNTQWTEQDRTKSLGETVLRISKLLSDAKCDHVSDLVGVPVEIELEGNALKSWRVLKEVL